MKVKVKSLSRVGLFATPWTVAPRLLCPWDSPGKNTGVGCHFLLQCMKVKSESEVAQSCLTLCDPVECDLPGFSVREGGSPGKNTGAYCPILVAIPF